MEQRPQLETFWLHRIFGIDRQSSIATLAIVNMIFRGDGKNNINNDSCLNRGLVASTVDEKASAKFVSRTQASKGTKAVTKVLMNPPFALKKGAEKEYKFINHALDQMEDNGLLFSILPCSAMVKAGGYKTWRKELLKKNTLLSVITLPYDLFYPQSQPPPLAIIVKKGVKHPPNQNVLWIRVRTDGFRKVKHKRLRDNRIPDELDSVKGLVQNFVVNPNISAPSIEEFQKACPAVDFSDKDFELIPEAYIDAGIPSPDTIRQGVDENARELIAFLIRSKKEDML